MGKKVSSNIKEVGYDSAHVPSVPVPDCHGDSMLIPSANRTCFENWEVDLGASTGKTLLEAFHAVVPFSRPSDEPLHLPLQHVNKVNGAGIGTVPVGRVETFVLKPSMVVKLVSAGVTTEVRSVEMHRGGASRNRELGSKLYTILLVLINLALVCAPAVKQIESSAWQTSVRDYKYAEGRRYNFERQQQSRDTYDSLPPFDAVDERQPIQAGYSERETGSTHRPVHGVLLCTRSRLCENAAPSTQICPAHLGFLSTQRCYVPAMRIICVNKPASPVGHSFVPRIHMQIRIPSAKGMPSMHPFVDCTKPDEVDSYGKIDGGGLRFVFFCSAGEAKVVGFGCAAEGVYVPKHRVCVAQFENVTNLLKDFEKNIQAKLKKISVEHQIPTRPPFGLQNP